MFDARVDEKKDGKFEVKVRWNLMSVNEKEKKETR